MITQNLPGQPASRSMHLLRTKLNIPHPHADRVERPWLIQRLESGLKARLIVVSAPAGSGKTTLVSVWASQCKQSVAWVSLDERDNDPVRFWAYFISALQTIKPGVGESTLGMLQTPQPPPIEMQLHDLLRDIEDIPNDFYLVLDDYHVIKAETIHAGISYLVDHLPAQMHLVIAGRETPPLPLPQHRVRRELVEINPADMRFSVEEAGVFFTQVMKLDLSPAQIQSIETLTEGWVAGLQLAALSIQEIKDTPAFIKSFTGSHRYVFDYLAQEVLDHQPEDVRRFLLQTSILDRLNGALCDTVMETSGSQAVLEHLEKTNLFIVPLDPQR